MGGRREGEGGGKMGGRRGKGGKEEGRKVGGKGVREEPGTNVTKAI